MDRDLNAAMNLKGTSINTQPINLIIDPVAKLESGWVFMN